MFKFLMVKHFVYNSTSAPSGHKKNDFFRLKFGDQAQKDNSGLFITCNSFLEQKQAWFITGNFQDQGACASGAAWTPNNQFKDGADQNNPENHIKSFTSFDYWLPSFYSNNIVQFITRVALSMLLFVQKVASFQDATQGAQ
ncbi:MAG: hypothetical protein IPP06_06660 [Saprospiraceae bacterium]|nr:hypothetical protein [Candidatus Vicinibacter affinis]